MSEREPSPFQPPNPEQSEPKTAIEKKLSPEALEGIMEKVQDIDKLGTAYTSIDPKGNNAFSVLSDCLEQGIFPNYRESGNEPKETRAERWADGLNKGFFELNYFQIVGRATLNSSSTEALRTDVPQIHQSQYAHWGFTMLFDKSFLQETDYRSKYGKKKRSRLHKLEYEEFKRELEYGEFEAEEFSLPKKSRHKTESNEFLEPKVRINYGFITTTRIPPRRFLGVVLPPNTMKIERTSQVDKDLILINTVNAMIDTASRINNNRLLPIYDSYGNLLWPREMNYKDVKEFVTKREN